jgi:hypothetical protein
MPKKTKPEKTYKMVLFRVSCYRKSKPGKEEGVIQMTDDRHKLVKSIPEHHFDSYNELGAIVRKHMQEQAKNSGSSPR